MAGVEICVICGPEPSLSSLHPEIQKLWRPTFESLRSMTRIAPRFISESITLDPNLLGLMLVNTTQNQCLWTVQPSFDERSLAGHGLSPSMRLLILRTYYKKLVGELFPLGRPVESPDSASTGAESRSDPAQDITSTIKTNSTLSETSCKTSTRRSQKHDNPWGKGFVETSLGKHQIAETFRCADDHKCYAINAPPYQLFLLFSNLIPTYALRSVSHKTFEVLMSHGSTGKNKPKG